MQTAKNVTVIPATFNPQTHQPMQQKARRKVAGYARVSTDSDEQYTSYEAQVDYSRYLSFTASATVCIVLLRCSNRALSWSRII